MVPRDHRHWDLCFLDALQITGKLPVAQQLSVQAHIAADDQQVRPLPDHLLGEGLHDLPDVMGHLAVPMLHHVGKSAPLIRQLPGQIVDIGGDQDLQARLHLHDRLGLRVRKRLDDRGDGICRLLTLSLRLLFGLSDRGLCRDRDLLCRLTAAARSGQTKEQTGNGQRASAPHHP